MVFGCRVGGVQICLNLSVLVLELSLLIWYRRDAMGMVQKFYSKGCYGRSILLFCIEAFCTTAH
jgi:hypothetical protein